MERLNKIIFSRYRKAVLIISGALTAIICGVMNAVLIPAIESTTNGIRCFDMNFGYDYETAQKFLSALSSEGRAVYLHYQLPLDFIYPIAYTVFFTFVIALLIKKATVLNIIPFVLAAFDYCENVLSIVMLTSAELSKPLATFASAVTSVKTILMYIVFIIIIICIVYRLKHRSKK